MTQAPAGWHPQPDGRERYWDGAQWTDQYREGSAVAPQAYPAQPSQQPKKKHTLRNVLLVIAGLMVLTIGGCSVLAGAFLNEVDNAIEESEAKDKQPGGPDNPMDIKPGEAFEVDGFEYASGWTVGADQFGYIKIENLKVTNNREDEDSALVEIKFWNGKEVLASDDCTTDGIAPGTTVTLSCLGADKLPKDYDRITINDTF